MSYIYLQEQGEESSAECFSDIPQCVLSKSRNTPEKSYSRDNVTESCPDFQSGTTYEPLTGGRGGDVSISSAEDSPVRTSVPPGKAKVSTVSAPGCGPRWQELPMRYDLITSSWKTHRDLISEDLPESAVTLPKSGTILDGIPYLVPTLGGITKGKDYGAWPTPKAGDWKKVSRRKEYHLNRNRELNNSLVKAGLPTNEKGQYGAYHPSISEHLMGWPIGWTDLKPLEMDKIQQWLRRHSEF